MPFETIDIPLNLGVRRDLTELASGTTPPALSVCENAMFTLEGEVTGRQGCSGADGDTLQSLAPGLPSMLVPSIATEPDTRIGLGNYDGDPLIQAQGRMWRKRGDTWVDCGPFWSVRADYSALIGESTASDPEVWPHVGETITAFPCTNPIANYSDVDGGFPVANGVGLVGGKTDSKCCAGDALFTTDGANLRMLKGFPLETRTLIATDCLVSAVTNAPQRLWACKATVGTGYYVVYQTNAGSVKLLRLSLTGTVLNTLTLTTGILASGSALLSLGLAANATKISLVATGTADTILTKVITIASWTDAAVDSTHTEAVADSFRRVGCCVTSAGIVYITASLDVLGHIRILLRDVTAPGFILSRRIHGADGSSITLARERPIQHWRTIFPPQVLAGGRVLAGFSTVYLPYLFGSISSPTLTPRTSCTWQVWDITQDLREVSLVSAGEEDASLYAAGLGSACVVDDALTFGVLRGVIFSPGGVDVARAQRVTLTHVAATSTNVNGLNVFSGQYPYLLDGTSSFESCYPIMPRLQAQAFGPINAIDIGDEGSRTLSACWVWLDARGNTHRSAPAPLVTLDNPDRQEIRYQVTIPQWAANRPANSFAVEVYVSVSNPSQDADLHIASFTGESVPLTTWNTYNIAGVLGSLDLANSIVRGNRVLYTGGNILANERGFANNGIATVGGRVWTAEGSTAYASKFIRPGDAPAWSTDDSLHLTVPSGYGEIRALGGLDNMLVLVCEEATLVFQGQGPGDAGGPSDFSEPRRVYRAKGPVNPSDLVESGAAVVWTSSSGEAHAIGPGGGCTNIGKPTQDSVLSRPTFILGGNSSNDLLVFRCTDPTKLEVLDMSVGQWSTWLFPAYSITDVGVGGEALHLLLASAPYVVKMNPNAGYVDQTAVTQIDVITTLETRLLPLGRLGRVRSIKLKGRKTEEDVSLDLSVLMDEDKLGITENSHIYGLQDETQVWPRSDLPEFRLGVQRMESFAVRLSFSPGAIELTGIQAEVQSGTSNPRNQRG